MIPLYGFLEGDTIGLLILAQPEDTMNVLANKLQTSAAVRVPRREHVAVIYHDRRLDGDATVAQVGIGALDRFDVVAVPGA
jgi:hypothetical protein